MLIFKMQNIYMKRLVIPVETRYSHWCNYTHLQNHLLFDRCGDSVERFALDLPSIGRISAGEVGFGFLIPSEQPLQPVQTSLTKSAAVLVEKGSSVANIDVPFPGWDPRWESIVISLALYS